MKNTECYMQEHLPADFYTRIERGEYNCELYPRFSDRAAWEKAAKSSFAEKIIKEADLIPENSVPQLLFSNYRQYNINGNRIEYETPYFNRRKNIAFLALALCLTGDKDKYMARVLDYTVAILEERTWCLPAHARWAREDANRWRWCDLFAAETAAVMALLYQVLGEELEKEIYGISENIREKTLASSLDLVFDKNLEHWWDIQEVPANWTVWCSSNCIAAALILEKDCAKLASQIEHFLANTSRFITHYADDGYCAEGPSYYMKANLMVFQTLLWLEKALPGSAEELFKDKKIKAMMDFLPGVRIGKRHTVSFGDAQPILKQCPALIVAAGKYFDSSTLLGFSGDSEYYLGACGDFMMSLLAFLFDQPEKTSAANCDVAPQTVFENRLAVLRSDKLSVSLKSGNNDEPHNHNDLGHFELFSASTPVVLDAGTCDYEKIHFSDKRYTLWYTRGSGHNAPVLGEYEQINNARCTSTFTVDNNRIVCDLSKAYPQEAGVKEFERVIEFSSEKVVVADNFTLEKQLPATVNLLTACTPEVTENGIKLGNVLLELDGIEFYETEVMPVLTHTNECVLHNIWGGTVTAVRLKSSQSHYKMIFKLLK